MKIGKSHPSAGSVAGQLDAIGPHANVEPIRYYETARQHVAANGGKGVVIEERKTPRQWHAWLAYFAWLDSQTWPRGKKAATARSMRKGVTVPTEWPLGFDLSAPTAPLFEPDTDVDRKASPERRRELAALLRQAVAGVAPPDRRHGPPPDARDAWTPDAKAVAAAYHEARLAELANLPPARLSGALAAKYAPPEASEAWPGPPQPTASPGPSWAMSDDDVVF